MLRCRSPVNSGGGSSQRMIADRSLMSVNDGGGISTKLQNANLFQSKMQIMWLDIAISEVEIHTFLMSV